MNIFTFLATSITLPLTKKKVKVKINFRETLFFSIIVYFLIALLFFRLLLLYLAPDRFG